MTAATMGTAAAAPGGGHARLGDAAFARRPHPASTDGHTTCSCGQELDLCHHAHCPRCGHRRTAPTAAA